MAMNVSRLRADVDSGRTGDKTPGHDPAAAPLGTDEEAAGTPVPSDIAEQVRAREVRSDGDQLARQNATPSYEETLRSGRATSRVGLFWLVLAICVVLAALGFTWLVFG